MKKGFTLVELLAVIVILSIIGMITVPMATSYIETSRKKSYAISVDNAIEAAKEYVNKKEESHDFPAGGIDLSKVDLGLSSSLSGVIERNEEGVIEAKNVYNGEYCASGTKNSIVVKKVSSKQECTGIDTTPPEVKIMVNNVTTDSITIYVKATDSLSDIKSYQYCIGDECTEEIEAKNKANIHTFKNLKSNTEYEIRVIVKNENSGAPGYESSNTDQEEKIKVTTSGIEEAKFKVSSSNYAGNKEVEIIYPKGDYTFRYEILDLNETIKTSEVVTGNVKLNIVENSIIRAYVRSGDEEKQSELIVIGIDGLGPEVVVIMKEGYEKTKQITIEANDAGSGLASKAYSYDGGKKWVSNNKKTYRENTKVKLVVRDKLGNVTTKYKICPDNKYNDNNYKDCKEAEEIVIDGVDNVAPECELTVTKGTKGLNNWYTSNIEIGFKSVQDKAKDAEGNMVEGSGINESKSIIKESKITKEGQNIIVTGSVEDKVGNKGTCEIKVNVDLVNPTIPTSSILYADNRQNRGSINQYTNRPLWWGNFNATDTMSKVDHYEYSDGCTGVSNGNLNSSYVYTGLVDKKYCIRSVDRSGRTSNWSNPNYIKVDQVAPSVPTSNVRYNNASGTIKNDTNYTNQNLWWGDFSSTDRGSGINHYEYSDGCTGISNGISLGGNYRDTMNKRYCVRSVDNAGNYSNWSKPTYIKIDKIVPTCKSSGNDVWTNQDSVTITGICSDEGGSGCRSNASKVVSTSSSPGTVYDNAGNSSVCPVQTVKIDKIAPTCNLKVASGTLGNNGWYTSDVTIGFASTNDQGGSGIKSSTIENSKITQDGTHTVTGKVTDNAGNTGTCSITVKVDKTKPTCDFTGQSTTWTNSSRTLTGICNDSGSGCLTGNKTWTYSKGTTKTKALTYTVTDNAGNTNTCKQTVNVYVDKDKPTCKFTGESKIWTNQNRTITASCSDSGSGCTDRTASHQWKYTSGTTKKAQLSYTVEDEAGNTNTCTKNANVYVDKDKPTCTTTKTKINTTEGVTASFKCDDNGGSGVIQCTQQKTRRKSTKSYEIQDKAGNKGKCKVTVNSKEENGSCRTAKRCERAGCKTYNSCENSACGCESSTCTEYSCTLYKSCKYCEKYGVTYVTVQACRAKCSGVCDGAYCAADCDRYATGRHSSCGTEKVTGSACNNASSRSCTKWACSKNKTCQNSACGCKEYNRSEQQCGCEEYNKITVYY